VVVAVVVVVGDLSREQASSVIDDKEGNRDRATHTMRRTSFHRHLCILLPFPVRIQIHPRIIPLDTLQPPLRTPLTRPLTPTLNFILPTEHTSSLDSLSYPSTFTWFLDASFTNLGTIRTRTFCVAFFGITTAGNAAEFEACGGCGGGGFDAERFVAPGFAAF